MGDILELKHAGQSLDHQVFVPLIMTDLSDSHQRCPFGRKHTPYSRNNLHRPRHSRDLLQSDSESSNHWCYGGYSDPPDI